MPFIHAHQSSDGGSTNWTSRPVQTSGPPRRDLNKFATGGRQASQATGQVKRNFVPFVGSYSPNLSAEVGSTVRRPVPTVAQILIPSGGHDNPDALTGSDLWAVAGHGSLCGRRSTDFHRF
ncbi:hypothetical protein PGT21_020194 [Puccinia graminis f. sp. tritici]|uniref:Uncharacterized protein n=1 Tax=Puccinia graminis f. sp. tritici TaxID=56615 RepID=A0A5B0RFQ6_PUCGR|nr:hypothetical protein PGT21_020194 [Puccinia graminis f. sp. tritici]KAA1124580.1 hypothetical protein PGTUg99_018737 [Puccinia graminis f. sp. tritici]